MTQEEDSVVHLISESAFKKNFNKILLELDALYRGVFDESEAESLAALCLLAQVGIVKILSGSEQQARGLKRDVDFAKAEAYSRLRNDKVDGKKVSEAALAQLIVGDGEVNELYKQQNVAEKEARELSNLLNILKDAHLTFRALVKKGN